MGIGAAAVGTLSFEGTVEIEMTPGAVSSWALRVPIEPGDDPSRYDGAVVTCSGAGLPPIVRLTDGTEFLMQPRP